MAETRNPWLDAVDYGNNGQPTANANWNLLAAQDWSARRQRQDPSMLAITGDNETDEVLGSIPEQTRNSALQAALRMTQPQAGQMPGWGRVGNEWHVGNRTFTGDDAAGEQWVEEERKRQLAADSQRAAAMNAAMQGTSPWERFRAAPQMAALPGIQQRALYRYQMGIDPDLEAVNNLNRTKAARDMAFSDIRNIEGMMGFNPGEAIQGYDDATETYRIPQRMIRNPDATGADDMWLNQPERTGKMSRVMADRIRNSMRELGLYQDGGGMAMQPAMSREEKEALLRAKIAERDRWIEMQEAEARKKAAEAMLRQQERDADAEYLRSHPPYEPVPTW